MRSQILLEFLQVNKNQSVQEGYRRQILINVIRVLHNAPPLPSTPTPIFPTKKRNNIENNPAQSTA